MPRSEYLEQGGAGTRRGLQDGLGKGLNAAD
jgi:hypothetical protein